MHYVIILSIKKKIKYLDPFDGEKIVSQKQFKKLYQNIIGIFKKGEYKSEFKFSSILNYIAKQKNIVPWIIITTLIALTLSLTSSFYIKIIVDKIIPGSLNKTLETFTLLFIFLALFKTLNNLFKSYLIKKMSLKISITIFEKYFYKIKNSKISSLNKLELSDHIRRIGLIDIISQFLSKTLFLIFYQFILLFVSMSLLIWINIQLFAIALLTSGIISLITMVHQHLINSKYKSLVFHQMKSLSASIDIVSSIKTIKKFDYGKMLSLKQMQTYYDYKSSEYSVWNINQSQTTFLLAITSIAPIVLTYIASKQVIYSSLTLGSMMMFLSIFNQFLTPITSFSSIVVKMPLIKRDIDLLNFILNLEDEKLNKNGLCITKIESINIKNIYFEYEPGKKVLNIKKKEFKKRTILKGKNGSGKSTLLSILNQDYEHNGNLEINKIATQFHNKEHLRKMIFSYEPNQFIPNIAIADFITLNSLKRTSVFNECIQKYGIHKLLEDLDISLADIIENNGVSLSAGQRQAIFLLRLFTKKYGLILLDEAFENIDSKKTKWFKNAIEDFQKDAFIVEISHKSNTFQGEEVNIEKLG